MSLFSRERRAFTPSNQLGHLIRSDGFTRDWRATSLHVTPETAMRHSVVNASVQLIANLSMLDVAAYKQTGGRWVEGPPQRIITDPSVTVDPMDWRRQVLVSWLQYGTAFGVVAGTDRFGYPSQIELEPAKCVEVRQVGRYQWEWRLDGNVVRRWPDGELWVAPGLHTMPGVPVGVSPIEMALGSIGLGLAAEDFGASWFYDGAVPGSILYVDQPLDEEQARGLKARFIESVRGKREPFVAGSGVKYEQVQVSANESQFLETLDKNAATVARFFLVPPEEVAAPSGDSMTYSNAEARALALLTRCFQPWLALFEQRLTKLTARPYRARVQIDGLIVTDIKTRTEVDVADVTAHLRTINEVRASRGLPPVEGGDSITDPEPEPDPMAMRSLGLLEVLAARDPSINVDARTTVEPSRVDARTTVEPAQVTVTVPPPPAVTVDARTTVEPAQVHVDAPSIEVDARTTVEPPAVSVTVPERQVTVDARTTVDVPAAPRTRKVIDRNKAGDIIEIREEAE